MDILNLFSAFGLSASAGLNAYIPLLVVALLAKFTNLIKLQDPWNTMTSWWVIGILLFLSLIEFFADKVPAVNHVNDIIQTFVRPTAGAVVFAATATQVGKVDPVLAMIAGLLVAGGVHAVKALAIRPAVTATTGGTANIGVSMIEDAASTAVSILSVIIPVVVACILVIITAIIILRMFRKRHPHEPKPTT
jgi:cytochrome bd-type quinol oxidase subunit 2